MAYVIAIDIFLAGQAWCVAAKTYLSGGYLSEDRNNRRLNFSMTTDYRDEQGSPAGASGTVTGLYKYKPRTSAVAPGFGPLSVRP